MSDGVKFFDQSLNLSTGFSLLWNMLLILLQTKRRKYLLSGSIKETQPFFFLRPNYRKSPCKLWIKGCFTLEAGRNKGMLSAINWLIIKVACFYSQKAVVKGRQVCNTYIVEHSPVVSPL